MAVNDVRIYSTGGLDVVPTITYQTEGGATDILAGEPVKLKSAGSPYVIPLADNEPVIGTTTQVMGIAAKASTHTAAADGVVEIYDPMMMGVVYEAAATTPANIDTKAKLDALMNDRVLFDFGSSTYTVDEDAGDTATSGLQLVGGDFQEGTLQFRLRSGATEGPVA